QGEVPLTDAQLDSTGPIYLWYYLLKEAQVLGKELHLGPAGTVIVAETLIGLLDADPSSYRSAFPEWRPTLGRDGTFSLVDLLRIAGVAPG
ncbi:MAG: peroxidase family protein, partial [Streptosporangiaceae bacterium]